MSVAVNQPPLDTGIRVPVQRVPAGSRVPDATAALPDDPVVLKRMIQELLEALRGQRRESKQLQQRLDQLLRRLYGPKSERWDPKQPALFPERLATPPAAVAEPTPAESEDEAKSKQRGHGRRRMPKDLPRVQRRYTLTEAERCCPECGRDRVKIGEETSDPLDFKPAALFVIEHVHEK